MPLSDYSTNPSANISISGTDISEGCSPAGYNNALRQIMADIKSWSDAYVVNYPITIALGGTGSTTAAGALAALGALPAAGGTVGNLNLVGDMTILGKLTRTSYGVHPHFASTSMVGGRIYVQALGADPTGSPGDIVLEY